MKHSLFFLLFPILIFSQVQIGNDIDGEAAGDQAGWSVSQSEDGSILALGAPTSDANGSASGQVRLFENQSGDWVQLGQSINGEGTADQSGTSVSLSSNGAIVAIGAPRNDGNGNDSGHVRVFENQSGDWVQMGQDIDGETANNRFGASVSLSADGTIVAIGAPFNSSGAGASGHVRVFGYESGSWEQIGQDIEGESGGDFSGSAVSLSSNGNIVAIAAARNDGNGNDSGHVRVYENLSGNWIQIGLDIDGESAGDQSGASVSLSSNGNRLAIGATFNNGNGGNSGHVRVFENHSGNWTQIGLDINGEDPGDLFGWAVDLSADGSVLVGSGPANAASKGYAKIYQQQSSSWVQVGSDIDGEAVNNFSGRSVSLSANGQEVAVGANRNSDNGGDSGHVRVFELSDIILSTMEIPFQSQVKLYPNPASTHFGIEVSDNMRIKKLNIFNAQGQYISSTSSTIIDTSMLETGMYFIELEFLKGKLIKKLLVK